MRCLYVDQGGDQPRGDRRGKQIGGAVDDDGRGGHDPDRLLDEVAFFDDLPDPLAFDELLLAEAERAFDLLGLALSPPAVRVLVADLPLARAAISIWQTLATVAA